MKNFIKFLLPYKKWCFFFLYLLIGSVFFSARVDMLYCRLPSVLRSTQLGNLPLDLLLLTLLLFGAVCIWNELYRPWLITCRVNNAFETAGLCNGLGVYPTLQSVSPDKSRTHGQILHIKSVGLSVLDFGARVHRLESSLGGKIYCMVPGHRFTIDVYFLPQKYVRLSVFSPNDNAIGAIGIEQLINMLIVGPTGTGKSVAIKIILSKILTYRPDSTIWLLDFKKFDFHKFSSIPHYYGYTDSLQGLRDFYSAFKVTQEKGVAGEPQYLIIDEWGSFITSLDKKEAEQAKRILAELLMLGRAYQFIPIIGIQRPDASYFQGSRDNFHVCLALGNLSPEGQRMVFPDSVKEKITMCTQREGHLYIDGIGLEKIRIEDIADMDALDTSIWEAMSR